MKPLISISALFSTLSNTKMPIMYFEKPLLLSFSPPLDFRHKIPVPIV